MNFESAVAEMPVVAILRGVRPGEASAVAEALLTVLPADAGVIAVGACGAGLRSELYRAGDIPDNVFSKARAVAGALGQERSS